MLHLTENSSVVIIGPPGSGKTFVGHLLAEQSGLPLYSTDEFLKNDAVQALYAVMQFTGDKGFILEGMVGYRWLRKRRQLKLPPPDIVIQLDATDRQIEESYRKRKKRVSLERIKVFCRSHETILSDYYALDGDEPKVWIHSDSPHIAHLIGGGPAGAAPKD